MKKLLVVGVVALFLAGCNAGAFIQAVQKKAIQVCHFNPAVSMIDAIVQAVAGIDVGGVVALVCRAVDTLPTARLATRRGALITGVPSFVVNGKQILLQGEFVK